MESIISKNTVVSFNSPIFVNSLQSKRKLCCNCCMKYLENISRIKCQETGCDIFYCSDDCKIRAENIWHHYYCASGNISMFQDIYDYALQSNKNYILVSQLLIYMLTSFREIKGKTPSLIFRNLLQSFYDLFPCDEANIKFKSENIVQVPIILNDTKSFDEFSTNHMKIDPMNLNNSYPHVMNCRKSSSVQHSNHPDMIGVDDQDEESWNLFCNLLTIDDKNDTNSYDLSLHDWLKILKIVEYHSVSMVLENPLTNIAQNLPEKSENERLATIPTLNKYITKIKKKIDRDKRANKGVIQCCEGFQSLIDSYDYNNIEHLITRLAQAAMSTTDNPFVESSQTIDILVPGIASIRHSCLPNVTIECVYDEAAASSVNDKTDFGSFQSYPSVATLRVISLCDIYEGEELSRTFIELKDLNLNQRKQHLHRKGLITIDCLCPRCIYERSAGEPAPSYSYLLQGLEALQKKYGDVLALKYIRRLAEQNMQEERFTAAAQLYNLLISHNPDDGDAYHGFGAALLESNQWLQAHRVWEAGLVRCPTHTLMKSQIDKEKAYRKINISQQQKNITNNVENSENLNNVRPQSRGSYFRADIRGIPSIFLTKSPMLSMDECLAAIAITEKHVAHSELGGWTTGRHYAVPTTDIPVHTIPELLDWFNNVMGNILAPMLMEQFPDLGNEIRINDAFIVKYQCHDSLKGEVKERIDKESPLENIYDSTSSSSSSSSNNNNKLSQSQQRYLPIHMDQSTHSFTIALNSTSEYSGGGTYFVDLAAAIRPDIGNVLSFRGGNLLHGGEPITSGVRYIIAVFMYSSCLKEKEENTLRNQSTCLLADSLSVLSGKSERNKHHEILPELGNIFRENKKAKVAPSEEHLFKTGSTFSFEFLSNV